MLNHPLLPKLRRLKLSGILDTLETRAAQASRDQLSPTEFLAILLDDELERREQTRLSSRVTEAGVHPTKTLASFDFAAVPDLDRGRLADLATAAFVPRADNVILAGPVSRHTSSPSQRASANSPVSSRLSSIRRPRRLPDLT
jgi:DNA replication protein DnaC